MPISKRIAAYLEKGSWIRKLFEEGAQLKADGSGEPVYDLTLGNPDLEPPAEFNESIRKLIADESPGQHKYMANIGFQETREAVARSLASEYGLDFVADQVVMTVGAGGAMNALLKAVLDPGEEVIVIAPFFVEYRFYIENHGGEMVTVNASDDFNLDLDAISAAITDKTRVVLIDNPNNPTGVVYPQKTLNELGALLRDRSRGRSRPIFLLDDAPYRKLVYDIDRCPSVFEAYEWSLMATSHSKDLGLPGERIGFLAISPKCENWQAMAAATAFTNRTLGYVNAPALMQRVVTHLQDVTIDLDWYRSKRDLLYGELTRMGYEVPYPGGAFYMFPKAPGGDDVAFINELKKMRVLAVPGSGFGKPGHFRVAYCMDESIIKGALPSLEKAIKG
ncbi:MAG: pyridoxal phosphate-dependent aminotransferase [Polyangia bacterium]